MLSNQNPLKPSRPSLVRPPEGLAGCLCCQTKANGRKLTNRGLFLGGLVKNGILRLLEVLVSQLDIQQRLRDQERKLERERSRKSRTMLLLAKLLRLVEEVFHKKTWNDEKQKANPRAGAEKRRKAFEGWKWWVTFAWRAARRPAGRTVGASSSPGQRWICRPDRSDKVSSLCLRFSSTSSAWKVLWKPGWIESVDAAISTS